MRIGRKADINMKKTGGTVLTDPERYTNIILMLALNNELIDDDKKEYIELMLRDYKIACDTEMIAKLTRDDNNV